MPSFICPSAPPVLEDFMEETASLVKDRLKRIDKELEETKRKNILEISAKLQALYGEAGAKMMKKIMGKLGVPPRSLGD